MSTITSSGPSSPWRDRTVSAADALARIKSGDHVFVGTACATPLTLLAELERTPRPLADVRLVHFLASGRPPGQEVPVKPRFCHRVFFVGSELRPFVRTDKVEYVPISIAQVHKLIETGRIALDAAMIQVAPPDEEGMCSLGVSVDITLSAVRSARTVIAEINPNMPRTRGDSRIPFESIDFAVEVETQVIEYLHPPMDAVAQQIARYVARIIDDGATLQIGIGRVPNEMLKYLRNRRDLGIHSDVITEPLVDLVHEGVVTGARKTLHPGKVVASYCMGTRKLYDLIDDNEAFSFHPIDYVCDPQVIASNHRMVSVTQAFAIDLTGQVCADQFEGEFYSGVSSQPEFVRGAAASEGGKAIVCLASTTDDGGQSRIRALLHEGEGVTVARSDVHYMVTEYGTAYLFGKSVRERAIAIIELAHPQFRPSLLQEAKRLGYVPAEQKLKSRSAYPAEEERRLELKGGRKILLRPTRAADVDAMQELFYSLPEKDIYTRFFTNLQSLSVSKAQHLCSVSYEEEMAFVAVIGELDNEQVVGSSCYYVNASTNLADVAYMIHPEWQGVGLASALQAHLIDYARRKGLRGFTADVLTENDGMMAVFRKSGCEMTAKVASGAYEIILLF